MPQLILYRLRFRNRLRIGESPGPCIPSDTLFAALVDTWRRSGGDVAAWMQPFLEGRPPFLLSSAFPYAGEVRFFPAPVGLASRLSPAVIQTAGKAFKRLQFLSEALWRRALAGENLDAWLFPAEGQPPLKGVCLQGSRLWLTTGEADNLPDPFLKRKASELHALPRLHVWQDGRIPHVTVDRLTSAGNIFYTEQVSFTQGCGLWFAVQWLEHDASLAEYTFKTAFEKALSMLESDGLGSDRSVGGGAFSLERSKEGLFLPDPIPGQLNYLLSRYLPSPTELPQALTAPKAAYRLTSVGGWLRTLDGAAQRRKRLLMVSEGSLVQLNRFPAGHVEDVRPTFENPSGDVPHPVYRSGLALPAGWA